VWYFLSTLALSLLGIEKGEEHSAYLNWDVAEHKGKLLRYEIPSEDG